MYKVVVIRVVVGYIWSHVPSGDPLETLPRLHLRKELGTSDQERKIGYPPAP